MKEVGCKSIRAESFPLSHLLHYILDLLHGDRLGEVLIVLPRYCSRDQRCDPVNILAPLIVVFSHDLLILAHDLGTKNQNHQRIINKYS